MSPPLRSAMVLAMLAAGVGVGVSWASVQPNFDKLSEPDKAELTVRFEKEVWPLFKRHGKDGCIGCHVKNGSGLRLADNPEKDFRKMLKDGFFLKDDAGSLVGRMYEKDPKRKMPPPKSPQWSEADKKVVRAFVEEVHRREKK